MITRISLLVGVSISAVGQAFVATPGVTSSTRTFRSLDTSASTTGGVFPFHADAGRCFARPARCTRRGRGDGFNLRMMSQSVQIEDLCLTPQLEQMTKAFSAAPSDQVRHVQLLDMAGMAPPIDPAKKTEDNVVPGCLSRVYVAAEAKNGLIYYTVDSDSMLTKGLAAVLAQGLSGNSAEAIQLVKPYFVKMAGISTSLTPGRTNGFLNMLAVMKAKAKSLAEEAEEAERQGGGEEQGQSSTPMADKITERLQVLDPVRVSIEDESGGEEQKLVVQVVSTEFEGLNTLKRHRKVYGLLEDEMKVVHAVTLLTKTPEEVGL